ncbi:MAG: HAMP domain-containing protein, partial [Alphaproteobacteria bacterium]|nr:HAMP domain-containing protein [Alphaproteobacteria bacterium]
MDSIWSQKSSVNRDFSVLSGVIVFIALLTSLWVAYETFSDEAERISSQLSEEAGRIDKGFDSEIDRARYVLESVGRQIIQENTSDKTRIAQMLRAFDGNNEYYSVFLWVDSNLQAVTSSREGILNEPIDLADRPYIQQSKQQPFRIKIGQPSTGRISERMVIPMAMGLTDQTGRFIGSVTLSIDIENLSNRIKGYIHNPRVSFSILNSEGIALSNDDELSKGEAADEALLERVRANIALKNENGFLKSPTLFSRNRVFAYYLQSKYHDYHIVSAFISDHNAVRTLILPRMIQLLLVAAFLVSLLWLVRFRIIHPVQYLAEASGRIARGQTEVVLPATGPLEITLLGKNLERTVQYISEHRKIEEELVTKVLGLKTAKETAEISDQAKMQILQLLRPEILPALVEVMEIANLLAEG